MKKKGGRKIFGFMVKEEKEENWGSVPFYPNPICIDKINPNSSSR
ncbi:hypothetical protein GCM10007913_44190 [Devosia yakushimensis]|uniref:Uncharacterized protein n=1 Tax=Devosia yakushimensis TaxID=470028 RepID=A0ABQ5ULZ7_9HYPH|nr:hypothetical protein GCM10007913_44190 [Devosia yakushimensis]